MNIRQKKALYESIMNSVAKTVKAALSESLYDPYDEAVAKEVAVILSQINPKTFMAQCKGKTNTETAEFLYKMYLDKYDCNVLVKMLNRDTNITKALRNLGGFPLMYCLSMYCEEHCS